MMKKARKKTGFLLKVIFAVNVIFAISIILALFAPSTDPEKNYLPAFFGLAYPVLFYVNLFFIIFWAILRKRFAFLSIIAILAGTSMFFRFFQFGISSRNIPDHVETFTIASYNVQSFRTFYHHHSVEYLDSLTEFLLEVGPDIICFQEYYNDLVMDEDITGIFKRRLDLKYDYIHSRLTRFNRYQFGLAVLTKYPVIHQGFIKNANYEDELNTTNYAIFTDIVIHDDTFRLYNVHLESLRISEEEGIIQMFDETSPENIRKESQKLLSRLKTAFTFRAKQVKPIREHMNNSPYPVIVCGDFNDTPASWAYNQISFGLQDAFIKAGRGTGKTYIGKYPSFRIDYILTDKSLKIHRFENPRVYFSDHFPVYAVCSIHQKKQLDDN
jgi:endonuclease/exonuclease/phosphatase family metal-dependent hydrolase